MFLATLTIGFALIYLAGGLIFTVPLLCVDSPIIAEMRDQLRHFDFGGKSMSAFIVLLMFIVLWPLLHIVAARNAKHLGSND